MELGITGNGSGMTIRVVGDVDHPSLDNLRETINLCGRRSPSVIIDLSETRSIDAASLAELAALRFILQADGVTLTLSQPSEAVLAIVRESNLEAIVGL